jgi:exodeoxyribonuclease VII large subunit
MAQTQTARLESLRDKLEMLASKRVMTDQLAYVQDKRMELLHVQQRLGDLSDVLLNRKKQRFAALAASLEAMSPLKVLGRGYAIAQSADGRILKSDRDVTTGDRVSVTLGEGGFTAGVERALKEERK